MEKNFSTGQNRTGVSREPSAVKHPALPNAGEPSAVKHQALPQRV